MLDCTISFSLWWTIVKMAIYTQKCEQKWLLFGTREYIKEKYNILKFNQFMKSDKMLYIIYVDLESLIEKIDGCANNPEKSWTTKNRWACSWGVFNVNNLGIWSHRKQAYFISWGRLYERVSLIFQRTREKQLILKRQKWYG